MSLLLLVAAAGLLWFFVAKSSRKLGFADLTLRASLVIAFGIYQLITVVIVEGASVWNGLGATTVTIGWLLVVIMLATLLSRDIIDAARGAFDVGVANFWRRRIGSLSVDEIVSGAAVSAIFGCLIVIGWLYRPLNADSMAYHLARVEHWIQNGSVASYPAHFLAQIELAPLSAYHLTTLHLLTGTDRWDGYVELVAALICVLGASELARRLGLSGRGQAFCALLVATIPNLLLEATSTTNNLFAAAIGVTALVVLTSQSSSSGWRRRGVALGVVAGLAELSKGTLFALLGPVVLVLVAVAVRGSWRDAGPAITLRRTSGAIALMFVTAILVAGPFLARNLALFGGIGGPVTKSTIVLNPSLAGSMGNVLRTVSAQFLFGDGHGLINAISSSVVGTLGQINDVLGQANSVDYVMDPVPSPFQAGDFSVLTRFEDVGANPWHVVLIFSSLLIFAVGLLMNRRESWFFLILALALCVGFIAFAATAKWTIYAGRYYIVMLVVWTPLVAVAFSHLHKNVARFVAMFLVIACLPQLVDNYTRPLIRPSYRTASPLESYFAPATDEHEAARQAAVNAYDGLTSTIANSSCERVGIANLILVEYPIWAGLHSYGWQGTIHPVNVHNVSQSLAPANFNPCALIAQPSEPGYVSSYPEMSEMQFGTLTLFIDPTTLARSTKSGG